MKKKNQVKKAEIISVDSLRKSMDNIQALHEINGGRKSSKFRVAKRIAKPIIVSIESPVPYGCT